MSRDALNPSPASRHLSPPSVEGIARVVRVSGDQVWLEPEQTTSCGHCASSASCAAGARAAAGIGTVTSRLQARRFVLDNPQGSSGFHEGERVVVGVSERSLFSAALTAYGLPLVFALAAGSVTQAVYGADLTTMLGMAGGLFLGLLAARLKARRLAARGELSPRFLRRASPDETCGTLEERS